MRGAVAALLGQVHQESRRRAADIELRFGDRLSRCRRRLVGVDRRADDAVADHREQHSRGPRADPTGPGQGSVAGWARSTIGERIAVVVDHLDEIGRGLDFHAAGQSAKTEPSSAMICAVYLVGSLNAYAAKV